LGQKPDNGTDRTTCSCIRLSKKQYRVYSLLTKQYMSQEQVAKKLHRTRQTINEHTKRLETLGLIEPKDPNGNPKSYRPTFIIPVVSGSSTPVVSGPTKQMLRSVGKHPILVRDLSSGRIKKWRSPRKVGCKRDYNTVISADGHFIQIVRANSIAHSCAVIKESPLKIPWEIVDGMRGMRQYVYRHRFRNRNSALFNLKELDVTFVRQKTANSDELIIYMPEKYLFEYELQQATRILNTYIWKAWKWFQKTFKFILSNPSPYRPTEYAHEILDPKLKKFVHEQGMVKVKTERGYASVDESKKGFPEKEYTSIEEVEADLHMPERLLKLELKTEKLTEQINILVKVQEVFVSNQEKQNQLLQNITGLIQTNKSLPSSATHEDLYIDVA